MNWAYIALLTGVAALVLAGGLSGLRLAKTSSAMGEDEILGLYVWASGPDDFGRIIRYLRTMCVVMSVVCVTSILGAMGIVLLGLLAWSSGLGVSLSMVFGFALLGMVAFASFADCAAKRGLLQRTRSLACGHAGCMRS